MSRNVIFIAVLVCSINEVSADGGEKNQQGEKFFQIYFLLDYTFSCPSRFLLEYLLLSFEIKDVSCVWIPVAKYLCIKHTCMANHASI